MAQPTVLPRSCTQDGCDRAHRAKGLCSTHYNQVMQPNRHKAIAARCVVCDVEVSGKYQSGARQYVCSTECRWWMNPQSVLSLPLPRTHRAHPEFGAVVRVQDLTVSPYPPRRRAWVGITCGGCFQPYLSTNRQSQYCSMRCTYKVADLRRRAREHDAYVSHVNPGEIYVRDAWTCQLCMQPVDRDACVPDPRAPTLDHVVALANGGTHEPSNVQLACFRCNCVKGHR